jgi:hypothetical protein
MRSISIIVVVLGLLTGGIVWFAVGPQEPVHLCHVTASILGISNDASGLQRATVQLVNIGRRKTFSTPLYTLESRSGGTQRLVMTNLLAVLPSRVIELAPDESFTLTIEVPADKRAWRAGFWYGESSPPWTHRVYAWAAGKGIVEPRGRGFFAWTEWADEITAQPSDAPNDSPVTPLGNPDASREGRHR